MTLKPLCTTLAVLLLALASLALAFATAFALADNLGPTTRAGALSRSADYVYTADQAGSNTELRSGDAVTIPLASTSAAGAVQLSAATNSTSTSLAATPSAVKAVLEAANAHADAKAASVVYTHPSYTARTGKPAANHWAQPLFKNRRFLLPPTA